MFTLWTFNARLNGKVQDVLDEEYAIENGIEDFSDGDDENNSDAGSSEENGCHTEER